MSTELLANTLKRFRGIQVIGSATNSSGISAAIAQRNPDVLVISASLEDGQEMGLKVMRELREAIPGIKLIALLDTSPRESVVEAFWSGAHGIFIRSSAVKTLGKCICCVQKGQIWASSEQIRSVLESLTRLTLPRLNNTNATGMLTRREQNVLSCLAEGLSNREIAKRLGLSQHTVKNYLLHIFDKLGVSSRVEALVQTYGPDSPRAAQEVGARPKAEDNLLRDEMKRMLDFTYRRGKQDLPPIPLGLIHFYQNGHPNQSDPVTAYVWHEIVRSTSARLSEISREGRDRLAATMTPEELNAGKRLIEGWSRSFDAMTSEKQSAISAEWQKQQSRRAAF